MVLIGVGAFLTSLDNTIVSATVPSIAVDLSLGLAALQWVGVAYMLPFAVLLPLAGLVLDRIGPRRSLTGGLLLLGAASALGGMADSDVLLLVARALQGCAAAVLVPGLLSLLRTALPESRRAAGAALWTACLAGALTLGPALGGLFSEYAGWRSVLWLNVPVVLLMLALVPAGTVRLSTETEPAVVAGSPVQRRLLLTALAVQTLWGLGITGVVFYTPLVHQEWLGLGPLGAGIPLVLVAVGVVVAVPLVPFVVDRLGPHRVVAVGLVAVGLGLVAVAAVNGSPTLLPRVPGLLLVGLGSALTTPLTTVPLEAVDQRRAGAVSAALTVSRELSSAIGIALMSAVLVAVGAAATAGGAPPGASIATGYGAVLLVAGALQFVGAALAWAWLRPSFPARPATVPSSVGGSP